MTIKAVIFDVGGVLAYDIWEHLMFDDGGIVSLYKLNKSLVDEVGSKLWKKFAYQNTSKNNSWQKLEKEYWNTFNEIFQLPLSYNDFSQLTDKFIKPVDGLLNLLERLDTKKIDMAICSNNTEFWFERQRSKLELDRYFEKNKMILSSRIGVSKNSPDFKMFQTAVSALDVEKQDCIFIDDRVENIIQALNFGITSILFPSHSKSGEKYLSKLFEKMGIL